jgi:hypothetical protein
MSHVHPPGDLIEEVPSETRVVRTIKHGDTVYELLVGPCGQCGRHPVFRLIRTCGASLSVYEISADNHENLDDYVAKLHESFATIFDRPIFSLDERRLREAADIKRGWASRNAVIDDVESLLRVRIGLPTMCASRPLSP